MEVVSRPRETVANIIPQEQLLQPPEIDPVSEESCLVCNEADGDTVWIQCTE